ncbi:MAG: tetratricopeptide repeat protein [Bacteroidales bacterium]
MKKLLLYISIILLSKPGLAAVDAERLIAEGNESYKQGEYAVAAAKYDSVLSMGKESAYLYYNLGNACFKQNKLGPAILNYERAKQLAPHNERLNHNLEFARQRQKDDIEKLPLMFYVRWWKHITELFPLQTWGILSLVLIYVSALLWGWFIIAKQSRRKRRLFWTALITSLLFLFVLFVSLRNKNHIQQEKAAIVMDKVVTGKSSPERQSQDLFVIHEGLKVHIMNTIGSWYEVRLPDGTVGWLPADSIAVI